MIHVKTFVGADVALHLDSVAALRIEVFGGWPYLYAGDLEYENKYLATYARSPRSLFVLAFDGERVIGASTGIPLRDDIAAFQQPFVHCGIAMDDVFYCGESLVLDEYRGNGLGHRFFDEREAYARGLGFRISAFCAVERGRGDPRRPQGYRPNDAFWIKRGYQRQIDMFCELDWREIGDVEPSSHRLRFWLRTLPVTID